MTLEEAKTVKVGDIVRLKIPCSKYGSTNFFIEGQNYVVFSTNMEQDAYERIYVPVMRFSRNDSHTWAIHYSELELINRKGEQLTLGLD